MEKVLIIFYSRTGTTKKVAEVIREKLKCDIEEIISVEDRKGVRGYLLSGREASRKILTEIKPLQKNIPDYDLVILGTPIWAWKMSSPIRTVLENNKSKFKKLAAFCTMGGSGDIKTFAEIEEICSAKLIASMSLITTDVLADKFKDKVESYCATIINN